jgi:hypothetical protein
MWIHQSKFESYGAGNDGQIQQSYRSSLKPAMVEALVCASSWIKGAHNDNKVSLGVVCANVYTDLFLYVFLMQI